MSQNKSASYHSNGYNAQSACEHCEGIISHEGWCQTLNPVVYYARTIVACPDQLTIGDAIILHSLGVLWGDCHALNAVLRPSALPRAELLHKVERSPSKRQSSACSNRTSRHRVYEQVRTLITRHCSRPTISTTFLCR
jgi:hypothetical protein